MELIDNEDDILFSDSFIYNALDTALEHTSELSTCDHSGKVELPYLHIKELSRNLTVYDLCSKTLSYGSLTYARCTDQYGVVLGPSVKDLNYTLDFLISSEDPVDLTLGGSRRKVRTKLV